jgi:hypothetical protein
VCDTAFCCEHPARGRGWAPFACTATASAHLAPLAALVRPARVPDPAFCRKHPAKGRGRAPFACTATASAHLAHLAALPRRARVCDTAFCRKHPLAGALMVAADVARAAAGSSSVACAALADASMFAAEAATLLQEAAVWRLRHQLARRG